MPARIGHVLFAREARNSTLLFEGEGGKQGSLAVCVLCIRARRASTFKATGPRNTSRKLTH
jgi:hypothetical protein